MVGEGLQPFFAKFIHIVLLQSNDNTNNSDGARGIPRSAKMTMEAILSDRLAPPVGPFSHGVRSGDFLFMSGQVGQDPATGKLVEGGIDAEARQLFRNLKALLDTAGKAFGDVVRAGVFLTDIGDFAAVNAIYAEHFQAPFPARTTVAVAALPLGARIEIELLVRS